MTARLAAHPDVESRVSDVLERLVGAGVDVELVGGNGGAGGGSVDPLRALAEGTVELALVGMRALRGNAGERFTTVAVFPRDELRDLVVDLAGGGRGLAALPAGARVAVHGTRRVAFLRAHRPDLVVVRLDDHRIGEPSDADAVVTGAAEARQAGFADRVSEALDPRAWAPEPGKGALALLARHPIAEATALDHLPTRTALRTELALLDALDAPDDAPLGCFAQTSGRWIRLWAAAASADGGRLVRSDLTGPLDEPESLGAAVARQLRDRGVGIVLEGVGA